MKTTMVEAVHDGQGVNGSGGCQTRWANKGFCSGVTTADWLNSLGPDGDTYLVVDGKTVTNGDVRENWLRGSDHIRISKQMKVAA
jgi:hypothetical protein